MAIRSLSVTKLIIGLSAGSALALNQWLVWRAWAPGVLAAAAVGAGAFVAVRRSPRVTLSLLFGLAFTYPALLALLAPLRGHALDGVWTAGLLGAAFGLGGLRWSVGDRWRLALGTWGLAVGFSWPIIVLRETDFTLALLYEHHFALSKLGVAPPEQALWVSYVALVHLCGLLWIDAMLMRFGARDPSEFEREVVAPLALGGLAGAGMACYQMFVDYAAPTGTAFSSLHRATGLMLDANTFGVTAALSGLACAILGWPRKRAAALAALALAGLAVWGSGSRTAFGLFLIGSGAFVFQSTRDAPAAVRRKVLVAGALLLAAALTAQALRPAVGFEGGRLLAGLARPGTSVGGMVTSLWSRDGYGTLATRLIAQFPLAGIGVGSFHLFVIDFGLLELRNTLPADNAQNWFRHQLVELGMLGSIGWLAWVCLFLPVLAARPRAPGRARRARAVAMIVVALGLISLVGTPTQAMTVAMAFWIFVFWALALAERRDAMTLGLQHSRRWWAASMIPLILFLGLTARSATGQLRVPVRAQMAGWPYQQGFYQLDGSAAGGRFRWTERRAVAVIPVSAGYLPLRVRVAHPDAGQRPVDVEVWVNGRSVMNVRARSEQAWVRYLRIPPSMHWLMIEIDVSHTFEAPGADPRELGVAVDDWKVVDAPPPDAWVINPPTAFLPPRNPYN